MDLMLQLLANSRVFKNLTEDELLSLKPILERRHVNEGEVIFDANKKPEYLFYIESGSLTLGLSNKEYKTLQPGQLIGEIGVLNKDFRSGTVFAAEDSTVITISGTLLFDESYVAAAVALKIVRGLAKQITSYLRSREEISTMEIIESGEDEHVEFKSTLRWNLHAQKTDKAIEKAVLKTLAAFMNCSGGVLLIGVADDGTVLGLENDRFKNHDKLLLHLTNLIKERISTVHLQFLHFTFETYSGKELLRVDCKPASSPAYFLDDNTDHFFVRSGPSTSDLRLSKVYDYINERF
ncbi:MAG: putative DNA binding domain-containing protein [Cytophagales bacterium]|nr:putative DNA binding domain-containing protein [Cytophagales bacterium]